MSSRLKAHIGLIIANLIYGGNYTVAKLVMPEPIGPVGFIIIRVAAALILYFSIHQFFYKERIDKKDLPYLALCALFGVAINQVMFFKGLAITTPINAALIMTTTPVLVLIIAAIIIKERITFSKLTGILLGASGASILILFGKEMSFGSSTLLGDLFIFINALSYGTYLVLVKKMMAKYHPLTIIKWVFFFGIFFVTPFGYSQLEAVDWNSIIFSEWMAIAYVVIGTTFIAYFLNVLAMRQVTASVVSIYIYLQPFFATVIALFFSKDELTWLKVIAAALIFTGVYLVSVRGSGKEK